MLQWVEINKANRKKQEKIYLLEIYLNTEELGLIGSYQSVWPAVRCLAYKAQDGLASHTDLSLCS